MKRRRRRRARDGRAGLRARKFSARSHESFSCGPRAVPRRPRSFPGGAFPCHAVSRVPVTADATYTARLQSGRGRARLPSSSRDPRLASPASTRRYAATSTAALLRCRAYSVVFPPVTRLGGGLNLLSGNQLAEPTVRVRPEEAKSDFLILGFFFTLYYGVFTVNR